MSSKLFVKVVNHFPLVLETVLFMPFYLEVYACCFYNMQYNIYVSMAIMCAKRFAPTRKEDKIAGYMKTLKRLFYHKRFGLF